MLQEYDVGGEYAKGTYNGFIIDELERKVRRKGEEALAETPFEFNLPSGPVFASAATTGASAPFLDFSA